jgi:hypothetical protein
MSKEMKEWSAIGILGSLVVVLFASVNSLNKESLREVLSFVYAVIPEVGNLRERPKIDADIVSKMKTGDSLRLTTSNQVWAVRKSREVFSPVVSGEWYKVKHLRSLREGWVHKSIIGKYIHLGYYDSYVEGESIFEVEWL